MPSDPCQSGMDKEVIISQLKLNLREDLKKLEGRFKMDISEIYRRRTEGLILQIERDQFVNCAPILNYVSDLVQQLISSNPYLRRPKLILISSNPMPNATCLGEGTFIVTLGLLRRMKTDSELAFVLAHELAHYHLDHVNLAIKNRFSTPKKELDMDALRAGDIEVFSSLVYSNFHYTRKFEMEADSLGIILLRNNKMPLSSSLSVLSILDASDSSEFTASPDLRSHFSFTKFRFQDKWLLESKSEFQNTSNSSFIFSLDSLKTHPDISHRKQKLIKLYGISEEPMLHSSISLSEVLLDRQIVFATYNSKSYLASFYYTLKMIDKYPEDVRFKKRLVLLLQALYEARKKHEFGKYISPAIKKPEYLIPYNTFLNNLRMTEFAELAYHYFQSTIRFDENDEESYFLLWKSSVISNRTEVSERVKAAYQEKFPNGSYLLQMI